MVTAAVDTPVVVVTGVNDGTRPTTLTFLGLYLGHHTPWYRRITRRQRRKEEGHLIVPGYTDIRLPNAVMPKPIDVGEHAAVLFPHDLVQRHATSRATKP
jgi:hypothetical protein